MYVPRGACRAALAGLQQQRRVARRAVGAGHALDARMRARLARRVVAEPQVRIEAGRALFHASARRLEHGRRSAGQAVLFGEVAASLARRVTRLALRTGPKLACCSYR